MLTTATAGPPRYYQVKAFNGAIEAVATGRDRVLLETGDRHRRRIHGFSDHLAPMRIAGRKKLLLFLADRNMRIDQTMVNGYGPSIAAMTKLATNAKSNLGKLWQSIL